MSYILDALKKSEQQRQQADSQDQNKKATDAFAGSNHLSVGNTAAPAIHLTPVQNTSRRYWFLVALAIISIGFVMTILVVNLFKRSEDTVIPYIEPIPRISLTPSSELEINKSVNDLRAQRLPGGTSSTSDTMTQKLITSDPIDSNQMHSQTVQSTINSSDQASSSVQITALPQPASPTLSRNTALTSVSPSADSIQSTSQSDASNDQRFDALLGNGSVILPSKKSQLTAQQEQRMIEQAVRGDVDLSTYADVSDTTEESFVALTDSDIFESDLSGIVAPALVDNRISTKNNRVGTSSSPLPTLDQAVVDQVSTSTVSNRSVIDRPLVSTNSDSDFESYTQRVTSVSDQLVDEQLSVEPLSVNERRMVATSTSDTPQQTALAAGIDEDTNMEQKAVITALSSTSTQAVVTPRAMVSGSSETKPTVPRFNTGEPPLNVLVKLPDITVTGHLFSSSKDRRSVTFNNQTYSEGDRVTREVTLIEITRSGFNLEVDNYLVPIRRGRGWRAVSAN